jgi:3-hydroxybutyryl-CoA dehydrogenase
MLTENTRVAVFGAGTMGHGIAYLCAVAGHHTVVCDASADALLAASGKVDGLLARAVERGKIDSEAAEEARRLLSFQPDVEAAASMAGLVVEAIPEDLHLKQELLARVESFVAQGAIMASNTSALSIGKIAMALDRPERFLGLHFFNPVPAMRLLEIVRGKSTNDAVVEACKAFALALGKTPIVVNDSPGFATSRLGVVLGLEAMRMLEQGVASAEDIDRAMELGYNHPVGPLKLTDMVGLDVRLAIAEHLHATFGNDTYEPPQLLIELVKEGRLGKKTGRGFYDWTD